MNDQRSSFMKMIRENPKDESNRLVFADWCEENGDPELAAKLRAGQVPFMLRRGECQRFRESIIAQDDDNDYSESGYVVVRIGDWCAIASYGHYSCDDTWGDLTCGGIGDYEGPRDPEWDWQGTYAELLDMARRKADPRMPERIADPEDSDYDHLCAVYEQVLEKAEP